MGAGASTTNMDQLSAATREALEALPEDAKKELSAVAATMGPPKIDLSKAFAMFDSDGNGTLDPTELKRAFRALGIEHETVTDDIFKMIDTNADGKVSLEEFNTNLVGGYRQLLEASLDPSAGFTFDKNKWESSKPGGEIDVSAGPRFPLGKAFAMFDTDGNGTLDPSELKRAFRALGIEHETATDDLFKMIDTNADGKVSLEELDANLKGGYRQLLEACLDPSAGFTFDAAKWEASKPAA